MSAKISITIKNSINSAPFTLLQVALTTGLGNVVTLMQLERSEVAFFIFTNGSTLR